MFATGPANQLECLSQVLAGVYLALYPRTLTSLFELYYLF